MCSGWDRDSVTYNYKPKAASEGININEEIHKEQAIQYITYKYNNKQTAIKPVYNTSTILNESQTTKRQTSQYITKVQKQTAIMYVRNKTTKINKQKSDQLIAKLQKQTAIESLYNKTTKTNSNQASL